MRIDTKTFRIIVKTGKKNEVLGFDEMKSAYIISVQARPEKGKANAEIVKFLSKELKKPVRIRSGFTSRIKIIELLGS